MHPPPTDAVPPGDHRVHRLPRDGWTALTVSTVARAAAALLLGLVVWSQLPALLGWESTVVMSGSMSPALRPGDVAVVRAVDEDTSLLGHVLLVDDPDHPGELRLHRLVAVEEGGLRLQGDANAAADTSLVRPSAVHGSGVLRIPAVGLPLVWTAEQQWLPLAATGGLLVLVLAAATWHRPAGVEVAEPSAPRTAPRSSRRWSRGPGRHAAPVTPRRALLLRRAGIVTALLVAVPLLPDTAPASAAYTASTVHAGDSISTTLVSDWGCIDETAVSASRFYALRETSGATAYNTGTRVAAGNGTYRGGVTRGAAGPDCGHGATSAVTLDGSTGWVSTTGSVPQPDDVTVQVWFRTTVAGGKLIGFNQYETATGQYDRHVYMANSGQLVFGVYRNGYRTAISPPGRSYADGAWHVVTATLGSTGMHLYVDGGEVAADPTQTAGEPFTGYWRFGYGSLTNWPSAPTNTYFTGSLASAAVWSRALPATEVAKQYRPTR